MVLEHFPDEVKNHGWIEVICGSMFYGKTEELIRRLKHAEFAKQKILLIKPKVDNRYHKEKVVSYKGNILEAICVNTAHEILDNWSNEKIVAVDKTEFFDDKLVEVCTELSAKGVRLIFAGLDMDFKGVPFGPMPQLLSIAEYVSKVHTIYVSCGNLAQFSHRIVRAKRQVLLGATEEYKPLCRACFNKTEM